MPLPAACGRPRETSLREIVNATFYIAQTGCQCGMLPSDLPPFTTVQRYSAEQIIMVRRVFPHG